MSELTFVIIFNTKVWSLYKDGLNFVFEKKNNGFIFSTANRLTEEISILEYT